MVFWAVLLVSATSIKTTKILDTTFVANKNVNYKVSEDANNIYLNISTSDMSTMMSMLGAGVIVYFDVKGKQSEDVFVKYPLEPLKPNFDDEDMAIMGDFDSLEYENMMKQGIDKLIKNYLPEEAEYGYFNSQEQFHILLNTLDITLSYVYTYNENEAELEYHLKIPKHRICKDSKTDFSKLIIGIKTGETSGSRPEHDSDSRPADMHMGGGPGGRRGGGGPPPRMDDEDQNDRPSQVTIDFWFDANI